MLDLFSDASPWQEPLAEGAVILRRRARDEAEALYQAMMAIAAQNPFEHRITPGGHRMSVAMTNCGDFGWSTDARGYRYSEQDSSSQRQWPAMPDAFRLLARQSAEEAGFPGFNPDACLLNRYEAGAKLTLHQDKDEKDLRRSPAPFAITSLSDGRFRPSHKVRITIAIICHHFTLLADFHVW